MVLQNLQMQKNFALKGRHFYFLLPIEKPYRKNDEIETTDIEASNKDYDVYTEDVTIVVDEKATGNYY